MCLCGLDSHPRFALPQHAAPETSGRSACPHSLRPSVDLRLRRLRVPGQCPREQFRGVDAPYSRRLDCTPARPRLSQAISYCASNSGTALAPRERMSDVPAVADLSRTYERRQSGCPRCRKRGDAFRVRAEGGRTTIEYRCGGCGSEWTAEWTDSSRLLSAKAAKAHEPPPH